MDRLKQVFIKKIEQNILYNKEYIMRLDRRYSVYCSNRSPYDEFCKVNYHDEKNIHNIRIKLLENKKEEIYKATTLCINDLEIDVDSYIE